MVQKPHCIRFAVADRNGYRMLVQHEVNPEKQQTGQLAGDPCQPRYGRQPNRKRTRQSGRPATSSGHCEPSTTALVNTPDYQPAQFTSQLASCTADTCVNLGGLVDILQFRNIR